MSNKMTDAEINEKYFKATEQCIEIAEKIWGWESEYDRVLRETVWVIDSALRKRGLLYHKNDLVKEINSWQGFGRTVEAMHKRGSCIEIQHLASWVTFRCMDSMCQDSNHFHHKQTDDDLDYPQSLWEATHLAALEALK